MKHELIDRYIYATVKHLPQKQRADIEEELDSLIADMLEERCGEIIPTDKDVKVVLTELGTPGELAAKYSGEEHRSLISGIYFHTYKKVLKIVLPIAAAAVALGMIISVFSDPPVNQALLVLRLIGQTIGGTMAGAFQAFAIVTFIFAVLERTKADISGDCLSTLPPVPKKQERIKPYEPIIGILLSIVATALFLGFPQVLGLWRTDGGWLQLLNVDAIRSFWYLIILWAALGIAKEIIKFIEGRVTKRLAIVTIAANLIIMGSMAVVFLSKEIANREFFTYINEAIFADGSFTLTAETTFAIFTSAVCIALLIDIISTTAKAWKSYPI